MRCAKIGVIISMITSNYIERLAKAYGCAGAGTKSTRVVCKWTTMNSFISHKRERDKLVFYFLKKMLYVELISGASKPTLNTKYGVKRKRNDIFKIHKSLANCRI